MYTGTRVGKVVSVSSEYKCRLCMFRSPRRYLHSRRAKHRQDECAGDAMWRVPSPVSLCNNIACRQLCKQLFLSVNMIRTACNRLICLSSHVDAGFASQFIHAQFIRYLFVMLCEIKQMHIHAWTTLSIKSPAHAAPPMLLYCIILCCCNT